MKSTSSSKILLHPISILFYIVGISLLIFGIVYYSGDYGGFSGIGAGVFVIPFFIFYPLVKYKLVNFGEGKILTPLTLFFSALLLYPFGYNIYIFNEGNLGDNIIDNSIITTIVFTGLLASVLPFYNLASREFIITLLSILVLIFSGFLSFVGSLGTNHGISEIDAFTAGNVTAVVVAALILLLQTVNRKKLGSYLLN